MKRVDHFFKKEDMSILTPPPHRIIIELDKLLHNQLRNAMGNGQHLVHHHCFLLQD